MSERPVGEDDVWARAQAVLASTPPEPAGLQEARERHDRRLTRVAVVLTGAAAALALGTALLDPYGDLSTWRVVVSFTVVGLGLLLMAVGTWKRPGGSSRELTRALEWLTRRQRGELKRQVRSGDVAPTRLALARLQAVAMVDGRVEQFWRAGFAVCYLGLSILSHSWPRTIGALVLLVIVAVLALLQVRDERLARRFLEMHPG